MFKDKIEFAKAMLDGRKFRDKDNHKYHFDREDMQFLLDDAPLVYAWHMHARVTEIHPPKWYDNLPGHGILCWVWDTEKERGIAAIIDTYEDYHFWSGGTAWLNAVPLTPDEGMQYIYKEPEQ